VKNTITKRAAAEAGVAIDDDLLQGPTAIAFVKGDPVDAAKGLRDFARTNPLLVIKGGVLEGKALSAAEVNKIADLESREVLLAKLAGALKALPTRAAGLFQAPLSQMARLAKALEEKKPDVGPMIGNIKQEAPEAEAPAEAEATGPAEAEATAEAEPEAAAEAPEETPAEPAE
jgi:large subunit ribosomal protein L10